MEDVLLYFEKYRKEDFSKSMDFAKTVSLEIRGGGTGGGCGPPYLFEFFLYSTSNMILSSFL
jgi:hypothetical protein